METNTKKYLVTEVINTDIDACLNHESCIATCSDGGDADGAPWTFVSSSLLDNRDAAEKLAYKLLCERFEELNEQLDENSGWDIAASSRIDGCRILTSSNPRTLFMTKWGDRYDIIWLYKFDILEIDV